MKSDIVHVYVSYSMYSKITTSCSIHKEFSDISNECSSCRILNIAQHNFPFFQKLWAFSNAGYQFEF